MTILAIVFISMLLLFCLVGYTALNRPSWSELEKFQLPSQKTTLDEIRNSDRETVIALRGWILLVTLLLTVSWLHLPFFQTLDQTGQATTRIGIGLGGLMSLWFLLLLADLWLAQPIARLFGARIIWFSWPVLRGLRQLLTPALKVQAGIQWTLQQLLPKAHDKSLSPLQDEIISMVQEARRDTDAVMENTASMIAGLIELHEVTASDIMTPRTDIIMISRDSTIEQARQLIIEHGHSRIPVYQESRDDIIGVLYAKDLLPNLDQTENQSAPLSGIKLRQPVYVPESKQVDVLLEEFQRQRIHVAIVLDEYGGVTGLVTIEDILEEIVGDIADEYDEEESPPIHQVDERTFEVDARVRVDEINDTIPVELPEADDYDTVGGFVFTSLGRVPVAGESFQHRSTTFTILQANDRKIQRLRIELTIDSMQRDGVPVAVPSSHAVLPPDNSGSHVDKIGEDP